MKYLNESYDMVYLYQPIFENIVELKIDFSKIPSLLEPSSQTEKLLHENK